MVQAEPLIHWPEPIVEYIGFVAEFLAVGAIGFRYAAVRHRLGAGERVADGVPGDDAFYADACARAARIGLFGAVVQALMFANALPENAARAHTTVSGLVTHDLMTGAMAVLTVVGLIGLLLAATRRRVGWPLAAGGVLLTPLAGIVTLQWTRLVNPVHRLVASLWLGTLLVLVVAGLGYLLRDSRVHERRGAIAADLVNGFSPLALASGGILVLTGIITAIRHLNPFSSLWTHPYGWVLIWKLVFVAIVFGLGAWNWRRARPTLGSESAAVAIRRSSVRELVVAAIVLAFTAVLVSIPSPRPPRPAGAPVSGAPAGQ
jgi:putative copper export protein